MKEKIINKKKRLILLDAHAIIHRAYHALPDFKTKKGKPTGALYGVVAMLIKIISDFKPNYIVACYDLPKPTYRHELFEAYKAKRKKADEELISQLIHSRDIFKAFGIPIYEFPGFEADDLLGAISNQLKEEKNIEIIIASGDMDTLQIVDDKKIQVLTFKRGVSETVMYDEDAVEKRFGFKPKLLPDFKGLRGDPSDNIPGIRGIGEKTASILIQNFGSIENIYKCLKKDKSQFIKAGVKERIIGLLEKGKDEAEFSKMLATIRYDVPIKYSLPEKEWREFVDLDKVRELFKELEFKTMAIRVEELITGKSEAKKAVAKTTAVAIAIDAVTTTDATVAEKIEPRDLKEISIALWVIDSNITNPTLEDILKWSGKKTFADAKKAILDEIKKQKLLEVYEKIELPLIPIIEKMEKRGIKINREYLKKLSFEYHKELEKFEKRIWGVAGQEFNINSPKQLGEILFDKLKLEVKNQKKTAGGSRSTKESELEKLREKYPIISDILGYRELQKLLSTYIDNIPELLDENNRVHTTFLQTGTTTGRMASKNPNLQNIPIKTELGRNIRNTFINDTDFIFLDFDYSQIELRIATFLSGDKKLIDIFNTGRDVHTEVASYMFNVPAEKVDKEMRRRAKVINFGIIYGMGVNALKQNLGTDRTTAQKFYDDYFNTFTGLASYLEKVKKDAYEIGYTETYFSRRRYFPMLQSRLPFIRAMAERMAINAPIQGTEADVIKIAMKKVDEFIKKEKLENDMFLILQVHDNLLYEIKESLIDKVAPKIKEIMESVILPKKIYGITLKTCVSRGEKWGELTDFKI